MYEFQDKFLELIYKLRTPFFDPIFRFLNYFDTEYFIFVLIPLIWIGFSWRWGLRLFYLTLFSAFVNAFLKDLLSLPRPNSEFALIVVKGFGFPSGAAQNAMLFGGLLIYLWKSKWSWIIGISYILLISFSRLYLGVHYPGDLIGGWVIGGFILILFMGLVNKVEDQVKKYPILSLIIVECVAILFILIYPKPKNFYLMSALISGSLGIYLSLHYDLYLSYPKTIMIGLKRSFIAVVGCFIIFFLTLFIQLHPVPLIFLKSILISLWISLLVSPFCELVLSKD